MRDPRCISKNIDVSLIGRLESEGRYSYIVEEKSSIRTLQWQTWASRAFDYGGCFAKYNMSHILPVNKASAKEGLNHHQNILDRCTEPFKLTQRGTHLEVEDCLGKVLVSEPPVCLMGKNETYNLCLSKIEIPLLGLCNCLLNKRETSTGILSFHYIPYSTALRNLAKYAKHLYFRCIPPYIKQHPPTPHPSQQPSDFDMILLHHTATIYCSTIVHHTPATAITRQSSIYHILHDMYGMPLHIAMACRAIDSR